MSNTSQRPFPFLRGPAHQGGMLTGSASTGSASSKSRPYPTIEYDDDTGTTKSLGKRYKTALMMRKLLSFVEKSVLGVLPPEDGPVKAQRKPQGSTHIPKNEQLSPQNEELVLYGQSDQNMAHLGLYLNIRECDMVEVQRFNQNGVKQISYTELFFTKEQEYRDFKSWQDEYLKKFSQGTEGFTYPPPSDGVYPHCVELVTPHGQYVDTSVMAPYWHWCSENCTGEVRIIGNHFFFDNEEDATMFKLKL